MDISSQVVVIWAANNGYFDNFPIGEITAAEEKLLTLFTTNKKLKDYLDEKKIIDENAEQELHKLLNRQLAHFEARRAGQVSTELKTVSSVITRKSKTKSKRRKSRR